MPLERACNLIDRNLMDFWDVVNKLAARARERGILGPDGNPIWSLAEWQRFCRAVKEHKTFPFTGGLLFTVHEVEEMISDGYAAREIHDILRGGENVKDVQQYALEKLG